MTGCRPDTRATGTTTIFRLLSAPAESVAVGTSAAVGAAPGKAVAKGQLMKRILGLTSMTALAMAACSIAAGDPASENTEAISAPLSSNFAGVRPAGIQVRNRPN